MKADRTKEERVVAAALERFARARRQRLEIRMRDHTSFAVPVRFAINGRQLVVRVDEGRVIEHLEDHRAVNIVSCTIHGRRRDESLLLCRAQLIPSREEARVRAVICSRYRLWRFIGRLCPKEARYAEHTHFTYPKVVGSEGEPLEEDSTGSEADENSDDTPGAA